jgi:diguanylate cyclase (GGDEF)-like protein
MSSVAMRDSNSAQVDRFVSNPSRQTSRREILSIERWKHISEKGLESALSSALLASDKDLRQVVDEVDDLSKTLKSDLADKHTARVALHPAVWGAVKQTLLDRELRYLALTDDLTCLYNRRGFFAAATQQLKLASRRVQGLSLFFCDVDNLKGINDSYDHREGDLALIRAADALEQTFRGSDILARLGGDEFAVLALEASSENHRGILRRLERSLKKSNGEESLYGLSLTVGVACFDPKNPVPLGELMARADQDLYERKRNKQRT